MEREIGVPQERDRLIKIEVGTLLVALTLLGGFWVYCEGHFASAESIKQEEDVRRELKGDIVKRLDRIENKIDSLTR